MVCTLILHLSRYKETRLYFHKFITKSTDEVLILMVVNAKSISILISAVGVGTIVFSVLPASIFAQTSNPPMNNTTDTVHDNTTNI
jgi:hypothetical protein